ncbi:hypothetical protein GCM10023168_28570 [Fodinibacter luteus]|uniref:Zinc-finger domain-containing protein n=1 Tax=Fodinibacter luteus TaxID=552064 RepID=A0ABP8KL26_9MICO
MNTHRTDWHVEDEDLAAYGTGSLASVPATSVEAHLMGCEGCRERLARTGQPQDIEDAWLTLADAVDRPSTGPLGRLTGRHHLLRSSVATPTMLAAALAGIALVVAVPLVAAVVAGDAALVALLVGAPLAPVTAAGLAYRDWADPAGEISLATPSTGLPLVAKRALLVSVGALLAAGVSLFVVSTWVAAPAALFFSWCLPGLALSALVMLAGTTRLDPLRVALGLGLTWAAAVVAGSWAPRSLRPEAVLHVLATPELQTAALSIVVVSLFTTVARRDLVSYRRTA